MAVTLGPGEAYKPNYLYNLIAQFNNQHLNIAVMIHWQEHFQTEALVDSKPSFLFLLWHSVRNIMC